MSDSTTPSVLSNPVAFSQGVPTANTFEQLEALVHNVHSLRRDLMARYLDPRRNIDRECGFPDSLSAEQYWDLYQRDAIAARVVECVPRAVWQKQPTIYEDEDAETETPFECAWDELGKGLRGERSFYQDESGNPVMSVLERADILSGIGQYGIILLGLDDGCDLREPVRGVEEKYSMPAKVTKRKPMPKPGETGVETDGDKEESRQADPMKGRKPKGTYSLNWNAPAPHPKAKWNPTLNAYVPPRNPRDYDGKDEYEEFPKDPVDAEEPESTLSDFDESGEEDVPTDGKTPCRKLLYIRAFSEASAQIVRYETNPTSPRFNQPVEYLVTFNDSREHSWQGVRTVAPQYQRSVHWTRVVHIPSEGRLSSDVFGTERLKQLYRPILSLQKIVHGDPEMYWKGAFPGISFETHPQLGGQVDVDKSAAREQIEQYQNGLQRFLMSMGMTAKMLSPTIADPKPHFDMLVDVICMRLEVPIPVFKGYEIGEQASTNNDETWDDRVRAYQTNDRNPRVIIPLVDRLINVGALPEPCGFSIEWPDLSTTGAEQQAQFALTMTQAMVAYLQGNGASFMAPMDYLTTLWGLDEEEAQSIVDNAEAIAEELAAQQEEEMLAQMDLQEDALDRGIVADPNDPDLIPDQVGGGAPPFGGGGPPGTEVNGFPPKNGEPKPPGLNGTATKIVKNIKWKRKGVDVINCGGEGSGRPGPCPEGGEDLPKITPQVDNVLETIKATGAPFPRGHLASSKDVKTLLKVKEQGLIASSFANGQTSYSLTDLGERVVGTSKNVDSTSSGDGRAGQMRQARDNAASAKKVKSLFSRKGGRRGN